MIFLTIPTAILTALSSAAAAPDPVPVASLAPPALTAADEEKVPGPGDPAVWSGSVNIGASYSDGNTDARSVNAAAEAVRRAHDDRYTFKGYWNYGETRNTDTNEFDLTQRRAGASAKYDYFLSEKLYLFAIAGAETDTLADIKLRYYAGPGVGYQWREDEKLKWGSEAGVTYFDTDFYDGEDKEYIAARLANNISWKINEHTTFENTLEAFPSLEDKDDFYGKSDTKVKANLTDSMFAQLQWIYQFTNQPAPDKDRNDNLLVLGVGWSF
jgi:putative salt-induced outer membrane protein YdiY